MNDTEYYLNGYEMLDSARFRLTILLASSFYISAGILPKFVTSILQNLFSIDLIIWEYKIY